MSTVRAHKMRFVVVGPGGVGKSAITLSFVRDQFLEDYDPTIEDSYKKEFKVDGKDIELDITDTAGQEEFRGLWGDKHVHNGDGFIVVYSVIDAQTLDDLNQFVTQIHRVKDKTKVPMVIIGNKCDLEDQREVEAEAGQTAARKANATYIEASAKTGLNIDNLFNELVRLVWNDRERASVTAAQARAVPTSTDSNSVTAGASAASFKKGRGGKKRNSGCITL